MEPVLNNMGFLARIVFALLLAWCPAFLTQAATWHVATNGNNSADGQTWETALATISNAIAKATTDGDTVLVSNGVHYVNPTILIINGITLESVNGADHTTLDGEGARRVATISHSNALMRGFTIQNGNSSYGGGVYIASNATVTACIIRNNNGNYGSGVYIEYEGLVERCIIRDNTGTSHGGGIYFLNTTTADYSGGHARNCLITGHSAGTYGGGAYFFYGGQMDSCTVVDNWANYGGGVFSLRGNSTWRNSIFYFNTANPDHDDNWYSNGGGSSQNLCTTPTRGTDCRTNDPVFQDTDSFNYRLRAGSPCINAGKSNDWITAGTLDLDGNLRIDPDSGTNDIGAYEYQPVALDASFVATPTELFIGTPVVFTAVVAGTKTNNVEYLWDLDNDGLIDVQGTDKQVVTNLYNAGFYSASLTVTNPLGNTASQVREDYILVAVQTAYAAPDGAHQFPYTNWVTAATNIQDAVNAGMPGSEVMVAPGTYPLYEQLTIHDGIAVKSTGNAENTVLDGENRAIRCVWMQPDSLLDGFTITRGNGGGARFYYGGTIQNSIIISNTVSSMSGAGIYSYSGGTLLDSKVLYNTAAGSYQGGGIFMQSSFLARNCLFAFNEGRIGGGVRCEKGGSVRSCTIANNHARYQGGGLYLNQGGGIRNSVVYHNTADTDGPNYAILNKTSVSFNYTCTTPAVGPDQNAGEGNISGDPVFNESGAGDFSLYRTSPCIDAGQNIEWMDDTVDLAGNPRIYNDIVDIGAFEWIKPPGTIIFMK